MKYLKTYEDKRIDDLIQKIESWLNYHDMNIDIDPPINIGSFDAFEIVKMDDDWVIAYIYYDKTNYTSLEPRFWELNKLHKIWNYLRKLTPEKIKNMKIDKEAEKFNM